MQASTLISFCLIAGVLSQSHDLSLGTNSYGDIIIYKKNEWRNAFPLMVRTSMLDYPEEGLNNFATIKAIFIQDHDKDGSGGYPTIEAGGVGQKFVRIKLKSQRGYGFNFTITIYGRY